MDGRGQKWPSPMTLSAGRHGVVHNRGVHAARTGGYTVAISTRPLIDQTDEQIRAALRTMTTDFSYNALVGELDRRAANRKGASNDRVALVVAGATIVNALAALFAWATVAGVDLWPW
jgi:hypothetical protein